MQCELHHAGCKVMLPRKDMANHMKEDLIAHISLLTQELTQIKLVLSQIILSQSQEIMCVRAELEEAQRQAIDRLQTQHWYDLQELRTDVEMQIIVPVTTKMAGFKGLKGNRWYSRPFYTDMGVQMPMAVTTKALLSQFTAT